jgi:steroid delta-isomerase-like uncharacterized protein
MPKSTRNVILPAVDVARSFFAAFKDRDLNRMLAECSEGAEVRYVPMGSQGTGLVNKVGKTVWSSLFDAFPDLTVTVPTLFGDDRNVAAEAVIEGTQRKDFVGIPNQGRHFELPQAFIFQIDDLGLITSITVYWDNASFYSQLGETTLA